MPIHVVSTHELRAPIAVVGDRVPSEVDLPLRAVELEAQGDSTIITPDNVVFVSAGEIRADGADTTSE